jgi:hypothetical protein
MAKNKKLNPSNKNAKQEEPFSFEDVLASLPDDVRKEVEKHGINSFEDIIGFMLLNGLDPLKMMELSEEQIKNGDFSPEDVMLDDDFFDDLEDDDDDYDEEEDDDDYDEEEDDDDDSGFDDESYLLGLELPKHKFIGKPKREYHIRIKLNNAPVSIWRELVVPSNITLELLAFVLLDAMGWKHEHLYQFIGKNNVCYVNSRELKENANSFMAFMSRVQNKNSEKTSLEMVLQPKGERMKFEYDYGDSWTHDLWVKASRDYAPDEEPVIKLLKAQGECPPEDCGGVWGYANLLELNKKKRKTAEDKERLEWYDIPDGYAPETCDLEWLQEDVEDLWLRIKEEL